MVDFFSISTPSRKIKTKKPNRNTRILIEMTKFSKLPHFSPIFGFKE